MGTVGEGSTLTLALGVVVLGGAGDAAGLSPAVVSPSGLRERLRFNLIRIVGIGVVRLSSLDDASSAHEALECSSSDSALAAEAGDASPRSAIALPHLFRLGGPCPFARGRRKPLNNADKACTKKGSACSPPSRPRRRTVLARIWCLPRTVPRVARAIPRPRTFMSSYIDKPRFHKPAHPSRVKPAPADPTLEPIAKTRLALYTSPHVPADAPHLQSHAQAGIDMQKAAATDEAERQRQQNEQLAMLAKAKTELRKELPYVGVRCAATVCSTLARHPDVHEHVFRSKKSKHICADPQGDPTMRVLQLGAAENDIPEALADAVRAVDGVIIPHPVVFDWDYWSVDQVLRALLPEALEEGAPSAFSMVGHIAHVNLREEYLAYRYLIGQVILEKTPRVETVVNKLDTIETEFRVFAMELLAGEPKYEAEVSESGCLFTLDFRHVYWNSRLHTEHGRLIEQFKPFQVLADVMAGVGPFAVPAAKKGCWVLANDLNPACYNSLVYNAQRNKVEAHCRASCEDGRAFIRHSVIQAWDAAFPAEDPSLISGRQKRRQRREQQQQQQQQQSQPAAPAPAAPAQPAGRPRRLVDHFTMNLPATALEFLDAYRGLYSHLAAHAGREALQAELEARATMEEVEPYPMVHVHCFTKDVEHAGTDICAVRMSND